MCASVMQLYWVGIFSTIEIRRLLFEKVGSTLGLPHGHTCQLISKSHVSVSFTIFCQLFFVRRREWFVVLSCDFI